jgi:hypothetical protein
MGLFKRKKKEQEATPAPEVVSAGGDLVTAGSDPQSLTGNQSASAPAPTITTADGQAVTDPQLIAVITAAMQASAGIPQEHIAAITAAVRMMEEASGYGYGWERERRPVFRGRPPGWEGLYVQKIDRRAGRLPAWGEMGNREQIDTRRF